MKKISIVYSVFMITFLVSCNHSKEKSIVNEQENDNTIFPKGIRISNHNFTGTVWLQMLVNNDSTFNTSIGNVTFEPGARTNWHYHPGGQVLLITGGKGRYQEQGKAVREQRKGDVIKCGPNIIHWHGAAPGSQLSHIAIGTNFDKGAVVWLQPVSDKEYNHAND
jgi:quercetin dioxygenase-like cupin family protein